MASEQSEQLPEGLDAWLGRQADETERSREEILSRAVEAYQIFEELDHEPFHGAVAEASDDDIKGARQAANRSADIQTALDRLDRVEADLDEQVDDLRGRVIEVLQEAESRAPADHDHPELTHSLDELEMAVEHQSDRLGEVSDRIDQTGAHEEHRADRLATLAESIDEIEQKLQQLASATVKLQQRTDALEQRTSGIELLGDLKRKANQSGVEKAGCGNCDRTVDVGLLEKPRCPHCEHSFDGFVPSSGFFDDPTLSAGDRPAIEGQTTAARDSADLLNNNG
jgi:hypothetical protein